MELQGRVALVTGGSGGIGRAIALTLAEAGANVCVHYHTNHDAAADVVREIEGKGRRALAVRADVSNAVEVSGMVDEVSRQLGPIDILVNNAGIPAKGGIEEITEEEWDRVIDVNLKGPFLLTKALIPGMKQLQRGWIVNIASLGARKGSIAAASYGVSKAGLIALTIQTAFQMLPFGINVNTVSAGVIDTSLPNFYGKGRKEAALKFLPRGLGKPQDVADAVLFLVSPRSRYITGENIYVTGGMELSY